MNNIDARSLLALLALLVAAPAGAGDVSPTGLEIQTHQEEFARSARVHDSRDMDFDTMRRQHRWDLSAMHAGSRESMEGRPNLAHDAVAFSGQGAGVPEEESALRDCWDGPENEHLLNLAFEMDDRE